MHQKIPTTHKHNYSPTLNFSSSMTKSNKSSGLCIENILPRLCSLLCEGGTHVAESFFSLICWSTVIDDVSNNTVFCIPLFNLDVVGSIVFFFNNRAQMNDGYNIAVKRSRIDGRDIIAINVEGRVQTASSILHTASPKSLDKQFVQTLSPKDQQCTALKLHLAEHSQ